MLTDICRYAKMFSVFYGVFMSNGLEQKYQKQLSEMYELRGNGQGAVLSYIKRNFMRFDLGNEGDSILPIVAFAELGFDRVLTEMAERGLDFHHLKNIKTGLKQSENPLNQYLKKASWYDPDCLDVIIRAGKYTSQELAYSFISLCKEHKKLIEQGLLKTACVDLKTVFDSFLTHQMNLNEHVEKTMPFHALCDLYNTVKMPKYANNIPESYGQMLATCLDIALNNGADLNAVDGENRTAFSFNNMEMKAKFARFQKMKEDKRLLDLFMIMNQVLTGDETDESKALIKKHIADLQQDVLNYAKRARFINEREDR